MVRGVWGLVVWLAASAACAAQLDVAVADRAGRPVADAVVSLSRQGGGGPALAPAATHTVDQRALTFVPYVEVMRPGDAVVFRNSDTTRHHVYSFSPVKAFEAVVAPQASAAPVQVPRTGVVAVGCNIHDGMISYLYVTEAAWVARTDAAGHADFAHLPAGRYTVTVWHPQLPRTRPQVVLDDVALGEDGQQRLPVVLSLLPDPRQRFDRERARY